MNNKANITFSIPGVEKEDEENQNNFKKPIEHIDQTCALDTWTHMYTEDFSANESGRPWDLHMASWWHKRGRYNFKAELMAIKTTLEHIKKPKKTPAENKNTSYSVTLKLYYKG
ncbi:hypothetical protein ElyMa_006411600 [Elysia marginata]|uniref:Uncharacterized protein n=1 Tax=Elysia marginata TaxID=1093978 RepID=A0AAV4HUT1_9GAST|nr:hypothetical protein ElyMa_006411600 [Elysia marginata]